MSRKKTRKVKTKEFLPDPESLVERFDEALATLEVAIKSLEERESAYPELIVFNRAFKELLAVYEQVEMSNSPLACK